jgi:glycine/D-amino acid oxidase-like deaminating enzyme
MEERIVKKSVVVVGAGVVGLSCAHALSDSDWDVTVIDKGYPGGGSTGLANGIYTVSALPGVELHARILGARYLDDLERTGGLNLRRVGLIRLARDAQTLSLLEEAVGLSCEAGVTSLRVIDPEEVVKLFPHYNVKGNWVGARLTLAPPTPPDVRVRIRRFALRPGSGGRVR